MLVVMAALFLSYLSFSTARDWLPPQLYWCNPGMCQIDWDRRHIYVPHPDPYGLFIPLFLPQINGGSQTACL